MPLLAFGTGEGLLGYGICVPCSKRLPGVRDAFSEAFGVKNRRFRYGRHSVPKTAFSGTRRIFSARNGPRSDVSRHKKRVTSKSIKTF